MTATRALFPLAGLVVLALCAPVSAQESDTAGWALSCPTPQQPCSARLAEDNPPEGAPPFALVLERTPTGLALAFEAPFPRPDDARAMQWDVDERPLEVLAPDAFAPFGTLSHLYVSDPGAGGRILQGLAKGNRLRVSFLDALANAHEISFDLAGTQAAIARLSGEESRSGTGLPRVGPPTEKVRLEPPTRAQAVAALGVPLAVIEHHMRASDCEAPDSPGLSGAQTVIGVLSQVATLYALPCTAGAGAGNTATWRLYMRDSGEIGGVEDLVFAVHDPRFGWIGTELLPHPRFDGESLTLSASFTGRSDRHCGFSGRWVWQDYAFRLEEMKSPRSCADASAPSRWETRYARP